MKYLSDPVKTKGSGVNSLATPGEGIIIHVILAILVDGIVMACEAQDINLGCDTYHPCPCFANACEVNCSPVQ